MNAVNVSGKAVCQTRFKAHRAKQNREQVEEFKGGEKKQVPPKTDTRLMESIQCWRGAGGLTTVTTMQPQTAGHLQQKSLLMPTVMHP